MTALTLELEHKLATLNPSAAPATAPASREEELGYPKGYFKKFRGIFADEPFERPEQLPYEKREDWTTPQP